MKIAIILIKFLFIGALFIISNQNLYLSDAQDFSTFVDLYYAWLDELSVHALKITGYVMNSEWLPQGNVSIAGLEG